MTVVRIILHQIANIIRLISGSPITETPYCSATLGEDDVLIARHYLKDRSSWFDGQIVSEYEKKFSGWNESKYSFAFMSGRVALSACINALGLKPGDEVIIPAYTCVVVPNAFQYAGVRVVYCDIELDTFGLDASRIEDKLSPNTRAILLHHLYGLVCRDYEKIIRIAREHKLKIIEDCAHSTGAEFNGTKVGNFGDVAFYSSEHSKAFSTIQGGIAVTNDKDIALKMREYNKTAFYPDKKRIEDLLYNVLLDYYRFKHPKRWLTGDIAFLLYGKRRLVSTSSGEIRSERPDDYGMKMPDPIAAVGINQLKKLDSYNDVRRNTAKRWDTWCEEKGYKKATVVEGSVPIFLRYPVLVEQAKKMDLTWAIKELGIRPGVWFISNTHPAKRSIEGCPNASVAVNCCINLPCIL